LLFALYDSGSGVRRWRGTVSSIVNQKSQIIDLWDGTMEVAELKTMIGTLEARVVSIRDWL
jgi:hypothetical protein